MAAFLILLFVGQDVNQARPLYQAEYRRPQEMPKGYFDNPFYPLRSYNPLHPLNGKFRKDNPEAEKVKP